MALSHNQDVATSPVLTKIKQVLRALNQGPVGTHLYEQVHDLLNDLAGEQAELERGFAQIAYVLLESHIQLLPPDSDLHAQLRLLQHQLQPPLLAGDVSRLANNLALGAEELKKLRQQDERELGDSLLPLLGGSKSSSASPRRASWTRVSHEANGVQASSAGERAHRPHSEAAQITPIHQNDVETRKDVEQSDAQNQTTPQSERRSHQRRGTEERQPERNQRVAEQETPPQARDELRESLAQEVQETIAQNQEFGVMLDLLISELDQADSSRAVEAIRRDLVNQSQHLHQSHFGLTDKLDRIFRKLSVLQKDSKQIDEELHRARMESMTDDLTGLANRRAFLKRLEDEVARVRRYQNPLSLAIIDLDGFKDINDRYGHAAGDQILICYAKDVFPIFRYHDMVARYGGEEFAVLLPNTGDDGAICALTKIKERAATTECQANSSSLPLPTFSAGVAVYNHGESLNSFIERADHALYKAKRLGRDRVEISIVK